VRRPAATGLLALAALAAAGCGSSAKTAATTTAPTTTAPTAPTTTRATTTSETTTSAATTAPVTTTPTTTAPTVTATPPVIDQSVCPSEQGPGIQADFGHRRTTGAAESLVRKAGTVGFSGLTVQRQGCKDYAVVLLGLKNLRVARDFRREARSVGFPVRIECRSHPVQGGLAAVFGHRRTRRQAVKLKREAQHVGFRDLQVQQDRCYDWEVDLYGIQTPTQRDALAKEAASVGFHVTFEPG
jgi:hypothetical protein